MPAPTLLAEFLARDPAFRDIGPSRARDLEGAFGDGLAAALLSCDPSVAFVLGDALAERTCAAFIAKKAEWDLLHWAEDRGIHGRVPTRLLQRIARCWQNEGPGPIDDNPYVLLAFLPWSTVDELARTLGVSADDPRRVAGAMEAVLYQRLDENHTWTARTMVVDRASALLGASLPQRETAKAATMVRTVVEHRGAVEVADGLQPIGAAAMEAFLGARLPQLGEQPPVTDLVTSHVSPQDLDMALDRFDADQPFRLTSRQRAAARLAFASRFALLAGYAGSGKTASLRAVCDVAERHGRTVHLMALSGRAAQRMSQSTGRPAMTIARFLLNVVDPGSPPLGPDAMVIVDEASMLDLPTLWRIVRRLGDASLLLVGDPGQLPPIGFGLTFHHLIQRPDIPKVILDRVLRQSAASGIPAVAEAVRLGRVPSLPTFHGLVQGVSFVPCAPQDAFATIMAIGKRLRRDGMVQGDAQILCPIKGGPAGLVALNRGFHEHRVARSRNALPRFPGRPDLAEGTPILWTKNVWERGLVNGSMGRLVSVDAHGADAILDGDTHRLHPEDRTRLAPAYAISTHKAQGSQWPVVILSVFRSRLLDRSLLYTGITRASEQVVLVGSEKDFAMGVERVGADERQVGWTKGQAIRDTHPSSR